MRFSLRTLMLFFPALIVAYGLSYGCAEVRTSMRCGMKVWHNQLNALQHGLKYTEESKQPISVIKANQWFQGKLATYNKKTWWFIEREDHWGNPICCVALDAQNQTLPDVDLTKRYGFYSCGEDGISNSHGNDPDDLNTWNSTEDYYQKLSQQRHQEYLRSMALSSAPWFLGLVLLFWVGFRWLKHWLEPEPMDIQKYIDAI